MEKNEKREVCPLSNFSVSFPSVSLSRYSCPLACETEKGVRAPLAPTQQRVSLTGGGCCRETRLVVSLMAAEVSEARSKSPATGLATVPTTPLARPVKKP